MTDKSVADFVAYEPSTGRLTWRVSSSRAKVGHAAGHIDAHGYLRVRINGVNYLQHRLAWFIVHGEWPKGQIDHINGVRDDNRIVNLRDVNGTINNQNERHARKNSSTGLLGISPHKDKFKAQIKKDGKQTYLGLFKDADSAHAAYVAAKREMHAGCTL